MNEEYKKEDINTILQKRIEEAAANHKAYAEEFRLKSDTSFICGVDWYRNHQWISVKEALPPKESNDSSITVLVKCKRGWCGIDYYRYNYGEWLNNGDSVTHWMSIPDLKRGEK